mgnify:FL=1
MGICEFISAHADVASLVVFGLCVALFIWDKLPMATSAILGCTVMVLFGIGSFKDAFGSFASTTVIMLVSVLVVGMAIDETGVAGKIGKVIMKASRGSERVLMAVSYIIAFTLSTFMTNVTILAIFIPIIFALGKSNPNIHPMNHIIPITLAVNAGGVATLVGSSQQMTAQGLLEQYGYQTFGVFDFTPFGLAIGVVFLLYSLFIGYPLGKKIWGNRNTEALTKDIKEHKDQVEPKKAVAIAIIFTLMVFFYIVQKVPFTDIVVKPHVTAVLSALACIITGCISQKKAVLGINWDIVGRLAACLGLATVLKYAGGIDIIAGWFMKLAGANITPFALFAILGLFAQVTSLFISNSTAISIALLVVMSIAPTMGLNVTAFAMGIVFGASMGASCPLSGSTWGISMTAGYQFRDYFKYGIAVDALGYLTVLIMVPLVMGLTV